MSQAITITSSGTNTTAVDISKSNLMGFEFPAAKTGTGFALQVSRDGSTYLPVYTNDGSAVSLTAIASTATAHYLDPSYTAGWSYARLVASSAQSSAITIQAVTKRL